MEYSSIIWDPHTSVNINCVESVQRYAARMCFRNYSRYSSVTSMLAELNLPTLEERRIRAKLQLFYKIIYHLVTIPDNCLTPIPPSLRIVDILNNYTQMWTVLNSPSSHQPSNYGICSPET